MRRLSAAILTLVALVLGSTASAAPTTVIGTDYEGTQGFRFEHNLTIASNFAYEPPSAIAPAGARTVALKIVDDSGLPVDGHLHVDNNGDGKEEISRDFCNETDDPIAIKPRAVIEVWLFTGTCDAGPSMPTAGTIEMTFGR